MVYIDNVLKSLVCSPTDDIPLEIEHTCESEKWWHGRELDWSIHAIERGVERELPFPTCLPNKLTVSLNTPSGNHWFVNCKIDGVPLSIVATPTIKCGRMVAKVITIYQFSQIRNTRQAERRHKTAIRRAKRTNLKARRVL